jgi:hypothetical protein
MLEVVTDLRAEVTLVRLVPVARRVGRRDLHQTHEHGRRR